MTTKFEIYLGLCDKDTKTQLINTLDAYRITANICKACSISELTGYFVHDDGSFVIEKSLKIELMEKSENEVTAIAEQLKTIFNQEQVFINKIEVVSKLV